MADDATEYATNSLRNDGSWKIDQAVVKTCETVCYVYTKILVDAEHWDRTALNVNTRRLMTSLWFYWFGPLTDVWNSEDVNAESKRGFGRAGEYFIYQLRHMQQNIFDASGDNADDPSVVTDSFPQTMPASISAISPVELLARIAWGRGNYTTLIAYIADLQLTSLRGELRWNYGTPRIVFVCAGHRPPIFFVAESIARWGNFSALDAWSIEAHMSRFTIQERDVNHPITRKTVKFRQEVVRIYNEGKASINKISADEIRELEVGQMQDLINSRYQAMKNWTGRRDFFDHGGEQAIPLEVPFFTPKHRCYKCRSIYGYDVPPSIQIPGKPSVVVEGAGAEFFNDGTYGALHCGEVLCHCFCMREAARLAQETVKEEKKEKKQDESSSSGGAGKAIAEKAKTSKT